MKKLYFAALAAMLVGTQANATLVTVDRVPGYFSGDGGEFNISPIMGGGYAPSVIVANTLGHIGYESFCIDLQDTVAIPGTYNATVGSDFISLGTAYLYSQFAHGTLAGYVYTPGSGRAAEAWKLQNALWFLQGQQNLTLGITFATEQAIGASYIALAFTQFGANDTANANGAYSVHALDLNGLGPNAPKAQTQLVLPDGGMTIILLGLGLSSMAFVARKVRA